ncbi:MAG: hypothetical protein R3B82_16995 [Sandaracinaceae bacterium]
MSNRRRSILVAVGLVLLLSAALPFTVFWSRPCDEEIARARAAWLRYAEAVDGTRAADEARAVLDALDAEDLEAAVERGDDPLAAPPLGNDMAGARYREAVERLSLAEGACGR